MTTNTNAVLAQLRHLYANMMGGEVRDTAQTKRMAQGLLAPAIEALEQAALTTAAAPAAVAGPLDKLEELSLLNRLIELGAKAAHAHAKSNSDDGHAGTKAYVQWQELRAEMGELIRATYATPTTRAAPQPAVQQGDELPREDFAWLVVQEACETEPADEDDPECIRILRRDLKSAVLSAFLRHDAAHPAAPVAQGDGAEPVAYLWQHSETGRTRVVMPDAVITADASWRVIGPLFLAARSQAKEGA